MAYDLSWVTESIPIIIGKSTDMSESGSKFSISKNSIAKMKRLVKIFNITSKRQKTLVASPLVIFTEL